MDSVEPAAVPRDAPSEEARRQFLRDGSAELQDGDVADFIHIAAIPYVDCAAVDHRIADLIGKASRMLRQRNPAADVSGKVFPSPQALFAAKP